MKKKKKPVSDHCLIGCPHSHHSFPSSVTMVMLSNIWEGPLMNGMVSEDSGGGG